MTHLEAVLSNSLLYHESEDIKDFYNFTVNDIDKIKLSMTSMETTFEHVMDNPMTYMKCLMMTPKSLPGNWI